MRKIILFIPACMYSIFCIAQLGVNNAGTRANALGDAATCTVDGFSAANNPGAMAFVEQPTLAVSAISYFQFSDLTSAWLAVTLPTTQSGTFGLTFNFRGDATFQYNKAGLAYGIQLFDQLGMGIQLNALHTAIIQIEDSWDATAEIGLYYRPLREFTIGFRVFNAARINLESTVPGEVLPTIASMGIAYNPSDIIGIYLDGELQSDEEFRIKTGLEYRIAPILEVRGGFMTNPAQYTVGLGLLFDKFLLDFASQFHPQLGMSPATAFRYAF